jgi:transcription termination factor NusB
VVIDVAVKLAKTYLDAKDYKFVNAILDKVLTRDGK